MFLYHRTFAAKRILAEGFRDKTGTYMTDQEFTGVWFSDTPLSVNEGAAGDVVLAIEVPDELVAEYEWIEDGKPYREWLIPAELVNRFGPPAVVEDTA